MMKTLIAAVALAAALGGCKKKQEVVDNSATRYAESLKDDAARARAAADKANAASAEQQAQMQAAQDAR